MDKQGFLSDVGNTRLTNRGCKWPGCEYTRGKRGFCDGHAAQWARLSPAGRVRVMAGDGSDMIQCGDCGVQEGQLHQLHCDMERCPQCGDQLLSCDCYDLDDIPPCDAVRVRFVEYPIVCAKCGVLWPDFFMVPDGEWEHYIQIDQRESVLCRTCYDRIVALIDGGGEER